MLGKILIVLLISMVPLIELRGAIPVAVGMDLGLPEWFVLIIAIIGNIIPVPLIYFFARKVLEWGSKRKWKPFKKFCNFCLKKGEKGGQNSSKEQGNMAPISHSFSSSLSRFQALAPGLAPLLLVS